MSDDSASGVPRWIQENVPPELAESTLFKFQIKLAGSDTVVKVDMLSDIDTDYEILEEQLQDLPAMYAYWAALYSEVRTMVAVAERKVKVRRAEIYETYHRAASKARVPEYMIKQLLETDPQLNKLEIALANEQKKAGKLFHMIEAIKLKMDALRSLAGFKKQERQDTDK